jgi:hypothetical protein
MYQRTPAIAARQRQRPPHEHEQRHQQHRHQDLADALDAVAESFQEHERAGADDGRGTHGLQHE